MVSDADDITIELAVDLFSISAISSIATVPLKFGYRYSLNRSGFGLYVEPQAGYFFGSDDDEISHGPALAAGIGYMFAPFWHIQPNIGLSFNSNISVTPNRSFHYFALTFTQHFSFGERRE